MMKVLIADDDQSVRNSVRRVLEDADYEVTLAADGQEVLQHFEHADFDLLLLDIGLPIKNGWDAFERITIKNPTLPIIIITGQSGQYSTAAAAGVGALMEKPLDAPQLLRTMKDLLSEPKESRLRRLCGFEYNTRFVPSASARFMREIRERYATPMRFAIVDKVYD